MKTKPIRYEVEWCEQMPKLPDGSSDYDLAKYKFALFPNIGLARAHARRMAAQSPLRCATVTTQHHELTEWNEDDWRPGEVEEIDAPELLAAGVEVGR